MPNDTASLTPAQLAQLFQTNRKLLLAPAIAGAVIAALSTLVMPRDWKAVQGLVIRSDAAGYADQRLGKFTDLSEMKTVQETLLELARSQSVVTAVLTEVQGGEPTRQDIADFRDKLRLTPPGGAEFGKTEVFYVGVLNPSRERAIALVGALTRQLDLRLNELRDERAASMVAEVERSVEIARQQLHVQSEKLAAFEGGIGADLIELRHLTNPSGGQSELGQKVLAIDAERRQYAERRLQNEALLAELQAALGDPSRLLATPDALLNSQPALRRLKNGLIDAQLVVARTAGTRTMDHPLVLSARHGQEAVQRELIHELPIAIAGAELELEVAARRESDLAAQIAAIRDRSAVLASQRSQYAELVATVDGQTAVLEKSLKQLADARSALAGANSSSLLAPIDSVDTGANPVGAGRTTITAAGGMAGLLLGASLVFVLHAPRPAPAPAPVAAQRAPAPAVVRPNTVAVAKPSPPTASPAQVSTQVATKPAAVDPRTRREAVPLTTVSTVSTVSMGSPGAAAQVHSVSV